jgi:hypothetical protein
MALERENTAEESTGILMQKDHRTTRRKPVCCVVGEWVIDLLLFLHVIFPYSQQSDILQSSAERIICRQFQQILFLPENK